MDTLVVHVDLSFLDSSEKKWIVDTADEVSNSNKDADKSVFVRFYIVIWLCDI